MYTPDLWQCIRINDTIKVFAVWIGGFARADEWALNSGAKEIEENEYEFYVHGYSGSIYRLFKSLEGVSGWGATILDSLVKEIEDGGQLVYLLSMEDAIKFVKEQE